MASSDSSSDPSSALSSDPPSTPIPNTTSDASSGPSAPSSTLPTDLLSPPPSEPSQVPPTVPGPATGPSPEPPFTRANAHIFDALEAHTSQQLLLTAVKVLCDDAAVLARTTPARGEQYVAIAMELVTAFFASEGESISEPHVAANEIFKTTRREMERVGLELEEEEAERREDEEEGKRAVLEGRLPARGVRRARKKMEREEADREKEMAEMKKEGMRRAEKERREDEEKEKAEEERKVSGSGAKRVGVEEMERIKLAKKMVKEMARENEDRRVAAGTMCAERARYIAMKEVERITAELEKADEEKKKREVEEEKMLRLMGMRV
ncbi:hypothetical protein VE03_04775 [Pseudogymnoascus sp. 23342-1-I1]|nr:hypothetical protein VE03_04775 [Pseudogymnoascus sp. 23342-1-I1]